MLNHYKVSTLQFKALLGGLVIGALPAFYFLMVGADAFLFSVIKYHGLRTSLGYVADISQKLEIASRLFFLSIEAPQYLMLFFGACIAVVRSQNHREAIKLNFAVALSLFAISFLPTPAFDQYFCVTVPFLIVCTILGLDDLWSRTKNDTIKQKKALIILAVSMLAYIFPFVESAKSYLVTGASVIGVDNPEYNRISTMLDIADRVSHLAEPEEAVLATWPGYLLGTHAVPVRGLESHMATLELARALDENELRRRNVVSWATARRMIAEHQVRLVLLGMWAHDVERDKALLISGGYSVLDRVGGVVIFVRSDT
jgi:hypothetical protein